MCVAQVQLLLVPCCAMYMIVLYTSVYIVLDSCEDEISYANGYPPKCAGSRARTVSGRKERGGLTLWSRHSQISTVYRRWTKTFVTHSKLDGFPRSKYLGRSRRAQLSNATIAEQLQCCVAEISRSTFQSRQKSNFSQSLALSEGFPLG